MQGDAFCGAHSDQETCGESIEALMPYALPILAGALSSEAEGHCCLFSDSGICC